MPAPNAAIPIMRLECLTGRRVVIAGGATGIGASTVQAFAAQGADRIRIDTLSPGWTITERQKCWLTPEASAELFRTQCLPDQIQPEDVANFAVFSPRTRRVVHRSGI